jgi:hypothetical protein
MQVHFRGAGSGHFGKQWDATAVRKTACRPLVCYYLGVAAAAGATLRRAWVSELNS